MVVAWEYKCFHNECPLFSFFPLAFMAEHAIIGMDYPFGQLWLAALAVSPPHILLAFGGLDKALVLCQCCSAANKMLG